MGIMEVGATVGAIEQVMPWLLCAAPVTVAFVPGRARVRAKRAIVAFLGVALVGFANEAAKIYLSAQIASEIRSRTGEK